MNTVSRVRDVILAAAMICCTSCSSLAPQTWRDLYTGAPLEFTAPRDSSDAVWSRARSWFGGPLRPSLELATDTLLQSVRTRANVGYYSISMVRKSSADSGVRFIVAYSVVQSDPDGITAGRARDRAEELAYMAASADSPQAHLQRLSRKETEPIEDWRHP